LEVFPLKKLLSFLNPYKISIAIALFLMLFELTVELFLPLFMAKIIDDGVLQKDLSVVLRWGGIMVGISLLSFASGILNSFYAAHTGQSFGYDVRKALFEKVQSLSFADFQQFPTSSLITRMTNDVTQIQNTVFMSLRIMARAPLFVVGGLIMAFIVNMKLAFVLVAVVPLLILFLRWAFTKAHKLFRSSQAKLDKVNGVMQENLAGMRLIKVFLRGLHETKRFEEANDELMKRTVSGLRLIEFTMPLLLMVMNLSILGVLWFGSIQIGTGEGKVGEVVAIVNYGTRIAASLSMFSMIILVFSKAKASGQRILEVLESEGKTENFSSEEGVILQGKVEFKSVSFRYPGTDMAVLEDISFTANPGSMIAVLGATGSGKTSLFQLIPRLYEVNDGAIYIDDLDIRKINPDVLRKQIGFVPQESLLFTGSIKENLAWGKEDASLEEMMVAAQNAQIHETIMKLPKQYDAVIGQKGVNLSGGQKQRLAIARALVRKPKILLFDDSTSALDLKTEAKLLEALKQYQCTTLIITQKISTAMGADMILLLDDGKLLAKGDHKTLLKESTLYKRINQSQIGKGNVKHA
jgi:ATP-binding cassette, subfamily B, multidrug efflux pump